MITRPCANALEWFLRGRGKFEGAKVTTSEDCTTEEYSPGCFRIMPTNKGFFIKEWEVPGVPKPTDAEVETMIDQYEASKASWAQEKADIFKKMGVSEAEFKKVQG